MRTRAYIQIHIIGKMDLLVVCTDTESAESDLLLYFGGRGVVLQEGGAGTGTGVGGGGGVGGGKEPQLEAALLPILSSRPLVVGRALGQVLCCSVLQCVAVCCSVLQCVAACCSVLQRVAVCFSVF